MATVYPHIGHKRECHVKFTPKTDSKEQRKSKGMELAVDSECRLLAANVGSGNGESNRLTHHQHDQEQDNLYAENGQEGSSCCFKW